MRARISSLAVLLLTACIWGFAFVAQVQGMDHVQPFTLNGVRFGIGALSLIPVILIFERGKATKNERKRTFRASLAAGIVLFCASSLQQFGIQITGSAGIAGFITGLYTVFIPIACYVFFKQKTGVNVVIGAVFALVGMFFLCYRVGEGLHFGLGELLILIGAMFWTAHVMIIDRMGKSIRSLHFSMGQFAVCSILGLAAMFIFEEPSVGAILDAKWSILYCGVLSAGVAYTLQVVAQKKAEPTMAAIVLSTESMFSAIGGVMFGIDDLTVLGCIGCVLMFAGIVVSQISFKGNRADTADREKIE